MTQRPNSYNSSETADLLRSSQEEGRRSGQKPYMRSTAFPVTLVNGVVSVAHGLKRKPAGWLLHTILGASHAFVATAPDTANIAITANAAGSCTIEVW
jgi:hypothetical protein